jgi:uncharacterized protein
MSSDGMLRVAAMGDLHVMEDHSVSYRDLFGDISRQADVLVLTGDLTDLGKPREAELLAEDLRACAIPVVAVLGNHDWHCDRAGEVVGVLDEAGITVLDRSCCVTRVGDVDVGVVGAKGFVGGFPGSHLPDFGEPLLRAVYREASQDIDAIAAGLSELAMCPVRIVLLHYAPTDETLAGEPPGIWPFLGTDRLAAPIAEHEPDLVLHGHAHAGTFEGRIGDVPVRNVSVPVLRAPFWHHELAVAERAPAPIH